MFFHIRHRYNTCFLLLNYPLFSHSCFTHQYKNSTQFRLYASLIASQNTKGTVYEKYNVVDAIKEDLVPITTIEIPAGNYIIFVSNSVNNSQAGTISCAIKASSGKLSSMEMRGISNNGGGLLGCAYFTTTTKSTVTSFGYGYNSGDYKYQSLIIAVKL